MQNTPVEPADVTNCHPTNSETSRIIQHIRSSPPFRKVQDGRSNVTGRYPSQKMGHTIQFESHKVELAFIREYEFDDGVLEYYDQPGPIKISYRTNSGRQTTAFTTPDFFVIRSDGTAGWEECKREDDLVNLAEKSERFVRDDEGRWRCPPGEEYAAKYGLYFRVRSSAEINWVWQRNIEYLSDYFQAQDHPVDPDAASFLKAIVSCKQGVLLSELIESSEQDTPDDIFQLIARNELYVDIYAHLLCEQDRTPVYTSPEFAAACIVPVPSSGIPPVTTEPGSTIIWDGRTFQIVNSGDGNVWMRNDQGDITSFEHDKFCELVKTCAIRGLERKKGVHSDEVYKQLQQKNPSAYAAATKRYNIVSGYLTGASSRPTTRTERRWLKRYRDAVTLYDHGYLGLLDNKDKRGNRRPKLPAKSYELMNVSIDKQFLNATQIIPIITYGYYCNLCEQSDVIAASFKTFTKRIKQLDAMDVEMSRKGSRAAYQLDTFYWELTQTTSRHGDRPFEIVHLDHTELDVELVDSVTGKNLGRPWLTLMVDAWSRKILAYVLSFELPSYRSCMMVIRECVRIHNRLPQTIVVDRGADFNSAYFEKLIAFNTITKKERPGAKPRYGAVMERLFGITNTQFIHALVGNTKIMLTVRQVTKLVNPANLAVWTLSKLNERIRQYFMELYDTLDHSALGESPRSAFERGCAKHGMRSMKYVCYDDAFILSTMPSTPKEYAKVIRSRGVKINHFYYWHEVLRTAVDLDVPVRYDPYDVGTAYVCVKGQWFCCHSQFYALMSGRSEKEIALITEEIKKCRSNHNQKITVNAQKIAAFIAEIQEVEVDLKTLRRAAEMRLIETASPANKRPAVAPEPPVEPITEYEIYDELTT